MRIGIIDISSEKIDLVVVNTKKKNEYYYYKSLEYDGYMNGEFFNENEFKKKINELITGYEKESLSKLNYGIIGIPGEFTLVINKNINYKFQKTKKISEQDLKNLITRGKEYVDKEGYKVINSAPIFFNIDGNMLIEPIGKEAKDFSALVSYVMCNNYLINILDDALKNRNISFKYQSSILSQIIYLLSPEQRDNFAIHIDIGFLSSSVSYVKGDGLISSSSFSLGLGHIAGDLWHLNNMPYEHALELLRKINLNLHPLPDDEYHINISGKNFMYNVKNTNEIAAARLEEIASLIIQVVEKFKIDTEVEVYLSNIRANNLPGIKEVLSRLLGRKVHMIKLEDKTFNFTASSSLLSLILLYEKNFKFIKRGTNRFISKIKKIKGNKKWRKT